MAYAAKWYGEDKIFYKDQRKKKNIEDDSALLKEVWNLIDSADILLTQNGKSFDLKKLNARFVMSGMKPPSSYRHLDTLCIARKHFGFTSNKLEYLTNKLCTKYRKLTHSKYPGFDLWKQCMAGNTDAWNEMRRYNIHDILSTEELYTKLQAWDTSIDFSAYREDNKIVCACGHTKFSKNGFFWSGTGKFQRFKCIKCNRETRSKINLLSKEKKLSLKR